MRVSLFALYADLNNAPCFVSAMCFGQCDRHECPSYGNPLFLSESLFAMTVAETPLLKRQRSNMRTQGCVLWSVGNVSGVAPS